MTTEVLPGSEQVFPADQSDPVEVQTPPGEIAVWLSPEGIIRIKLPTNAVVTAEQAQEASAAVRAPAHQRDI